MAQETAQRLGDIEALLIKERDRRKFRHRVTTGLGILGEVAAMSNGLNALGYDFGADQSRFLTGQQRGLLVAWIPIYVVSAWLIALGRRNFEIGPSLRALPVALLTGPLMALSGAMRSDTPSTGGSSRQSAAGRRAAGGTDRGQLPASLINRDLAAEMLGGTVSITPSRRGASAAINGGGKEYHCVVVRIGEARARGVKTDPAAATQLEQGLAAVSGRWGISLQPMGFQPNEAERAAARKVLDHAASLISQVDPDR